MQKYADDLKPGDCILLKQNDFVPADILILTSSENIVYADTATITGEIYLKEKTDLDA